MKTIGLLLQTAGRKIEDGDNIEAIWADTKENIATFLREETAARTKPTIQSALEMKAARLNIRLAKQGPDERLMCCMWRQWGWCM